MGIVVESAGREETIPMTIVKNNAAMIRFNRRTLNGGALFYCHQQLHMDFEFMMLF